MSKQNEYEEEMMAVFSEFNERPIAYHRIYAKITGRSTNGLLLSQIMYWAKKMQWKEFYKTNEELCEETGLTIEELKSAKKNIKKFVDMNVRGVPPITHYKVNVNKIIKEIHQSIRGNPTNQSVGIPPINQGESHQSSTETTTENYPPTPQRGDAPDGADKNQKVQKVERALKEKNQEEVISSLSENSFLNSSPQTQPAARATPPSPATDVSVVYSEQTTLDKTIVEVFDIFRVTNKSIKNMYGNITQRKAIEELINLYGFEKTVQAAKYAVMVQSETYAPMITTPLILLKKFTELLGYFQRQQKKEESNFVFG